VQHYNIDTFNRHINQHTHELPSTEVGELNWLLAGIVLACKIIGQEVRRIGFSENRNAIEQTNVFGEQQTGLDVFANQVLTDCLGTRGNVALIASEEHERPIMLVENSHEGDFVVVFDPLDGSSNLDVNVSVGTIFSIYRKVHPNARPTAADTLQPGRDQVVAGYVVYGSSTMLVYSSGDGVHGFTLDATIGTFVLSHPNIKMPFRGAAYAVNESYVDAFPPYCRRFLNWLRTGMEGPPYRSRYIGSLVADFHRTLLKGGVFMYPPTACFPSGKLRLMYEANPIAFLAEQAGGVASNGHESILSIQPASLHERVPLYVGSRYEMEMLDAFVRKPLAV
jgi:fructose-1,6-bisphosphatase I